MVGSRSISLLTGALFAAMTISGCTSSQQSYPARTSSYSDQFIHGSSQAKYHESHREHAVEEDLGAPVLHDYSGESLSFVRESRIHRVDDALTHLDSLGVNIQERTEDARLVLSEGWDSSIVGKYFAAPTLGEALSDYRFDHSDEFYPPDPKGVMAVEVPSRRFDQPRQGSIYAGTILHEAVHNQIAQLSSRRRDSLFSCFRNVGDEEYRGDEWDSSGAVKTWVQGWMSRYASKNVHEDVASTTTLLLNERSEGDRSLEGPGRIPYTSIRGYMDESQRATGWKRIQRKIACLDEHDILFDNEYDHVSQAFSRDPVDVQRLRYEMTNPFIDTANSRQLYRGRE